MPPLSENDKKIAVSVEKLLGADDPTPSISSFTQSIVMGHFDSSLDSIANAIKYRQAEIAQAKAYALQVGDRVRFVHDARPSYYAGAEARVVGFKGGRSGRKIVVSLIEPVYNSAHRQITGHITCPPDILEVLDLPA